jgi:hypothetical protein
MPKLLRVQLDHAKIPHCVIKIGYRIMNGGLGNVNAMVIAQPILPAHASTSRQNRSGHVLKSDLIQSSIPDSTEIKVSYQQFPG